MPLPSCQELRTKFAAIKTLKRYFDERLVQLREMISADKNRKAIVLEAKQFRDVILVQTKNIRELMIPDEFKALLKNEREKLSQFFGFSIEIPPLPKEITVERMKRWESMQLELHYLPDMDMTNDKDFPGWKKKPNYRNLDKNKIAPGYTRLEGGWVLLDARPKPQWSNGDQMYDKDKNGNPNEDPLAPALEKLRKKNLIENFKHPTSRYNVSAEELEKPEVRAAFAKALNITPEQFSLLKEIEFNVLGNIHHPEWGETNISEWFQDQYTVGQSRLRGGDFDDGGLSYVNWGGRAFRNVDLGFRSLARFSR